MNEFHITQKQGLVSVSGIKYRIPATFFPFKYQVSDTQKKTRYPCLKANIF